MTDYLSSLLIWTADNDMQLNTFKTKEMILGCTDSTSNLSLSTPAGPIERVTTFKLLGLHLDASLSWTTHINTVCTKASNRLCFLKQLKRAGVPPDQLLHFYTTVIRPVLEYASAVCHYSITRAQSYQLESIQKRPVHRPIVVSDNRGMSYPNVLYVANLNSLKDRRDRLSRVFSILFANQIPVSITFFHLPATLLSFPDYTLPHLTLVQSHESKSFNHF